jgi:DNA-binding PadR family transcriptional regulator
MSAKHALLGLLLERPAYPYQLADQLKQRLGPAWKVNSGQLYQAVKALEKDGLIERVEAGDSDHEDRHVFGITEEGVCEFERFFHQDSEAVRLCRRPLLVKITFAGSRKLDEALAKIEAYEYECAQQLTQIGRLREELSADGPLLRADHLLLRLNLSADVFQLEGELRWARHAREMLSWLGSRDAVWPSERERFDGNARGGAREELFGRIARKESGDDGASTGGQSPGAG